MSQPQPWPRLKQAAELSAQAAPARCRNRNRPDSRSNPGRSRKATPTGKQTAAAATATQCVHFQTAPAAAARIRLQQSCRMGASNRSRMSQPLPHPVLPKPMWQPVRETTTAASLEQPAAAPAVITMAAILRAVVSPQRSRFALGDSTTAITVGHRTTAVGRRGSHASITTTYLRRRLVTCTNHSDDDNHFHCVVDHLTDSFKKLLVKTLKRPHALPMPVPRNASRCF
jgi:hypothetical protein